MEYPAAQHRCQNTWISSVETHTGLTQNHEGGVRMNDTTGRAYNKMASVQPSNELIKIPHVASLRYTTCLGGISAYRESRNATTNL